MKPKQLRYIKSIASIAFAVAFLAAIRIFGRIGTGVISLSTARIIFILFGGIGLLLNLISFQSSKQSAARNFVFWAGTIIIFTGFLFFTMHWPFGGVIIVLGMLVSGSSFFISSDAQKTSRDDNELLDDF